MAQEQQVAGALQKGSSAYEMANGSLLFTLRDPKSQIAETEAVPNIIIAGANRP